MSISRFFLILRHRWLGVALLTVTGLALAIAYALLAPKQYTSVASVVIDSKADPLSAIGVTDTLLSSYVNTQIDVIASERVAARAVKSIKLDQDPQQRRKWLSDTDGKGDITVWLADRVLDHNVAVGPGKAKNGNVINISAKWPDPKIAADLANAFAQAAIETNIELRIEPAKQFSKWFDQQSTVLRTRLAAKQKELSDFETANGIVATDEKLDLENKRLADLSSQLVDVQGLRQDSQSRSRQVSADNNGSLTEVLQSPVIAKLKSDLSDAEAREADAAGRLGKNHPDYQAAVAEVSNLHERILQETNRIASALGNNTQISMRRENDLRAAVEEQKKRVLDLKHKHDQASILENQVTTVQRDLDAVTQRLAQSTLESQQQQTNMVQLTTADVPFKPSSPKLLLSLLAGLVLGGGLGVAFALLAESHDELIREDSEVAQLLGVPTLVTIGAVKVKPRGRGSVEHLPRLEPSRI